MNSLTERALLSPVVFVEDHGIPWVYLGRKGHTGSTPGFSCLSCILHTGKISLKERTMLLFKKDTKTKNRNQFQHHGFGPLTNIFLNVGKKGFSHYLKHVPTVISQGKLQLHTCDVETGVKKESSWSKALSSGLHCFTSPYLSTLTASDKNNLW